MTQNTASGITMYNGSHLSFKDIINEAVYFNIQHRTTNILFDNNLYRPSSLSFKQIQTIMKSSGVNTHFLFFKSIIINMNFLIDNFEYKKINKENIILFFETYGLILKRETATRISVQLKKNQLNKRSKSIINP